MLYAGKLSGSIPGMEEPVVYALFFSVASMGNQQGSAPRNTKFTKMDKSWLAGFIEGEGTFNVAFKLSNQSKLGFYPSPMFSVSQHFLGKQILEMCKEVFGGIGGKVMFKPGSKTVMIYNVVGIDDLLNVVIPFLLQYNRLSARKTELDTFIEVCRMMKQRKHLTVDGLRFIVDLVFSTPLKKGGKRHYTHGELMDILADRSKVADLKLRTKWRKSKQNV